MTGHGLFIAWAIGLMCGVAVHASAAYRTALLGYMACVLALAAWGVPSNGMIGDLIMIAGFLFLAVGVTRGLVALLWERQEDEKQTVRSGAVSPLSGRWRQWWSRIRP